MADADLWTGYEQFPSQIAYNILETFTTSNLTIDDAYIAGAISEITYESQVIGPDLLTLTLIDPDWVIQTSGLCDVDSDGLLGMVDINFPNGTDVWWRLAMVENQGGDLSTASLQLVFQHRMISYLQEDWGPIKVAPGTKTQAQFIKQLADRVPRSLSTDVLGPGSLRSKQIQFVCPELNVIQPVATTTGTTTTAATANTSAQVNKTKGLGYGTSCTVMGTKMTRTQVDNANIALRAAETASASEVVMVAMMYAGMGETHLGGISMFAGPSYGVFQTSAGDYSGGHDTAAQSVGWLNGGVSFSGGGGIHWATVYSDAWQIANATEANRVWNNTKQDSYASYWSGGQPQGIAEAKNIVAEFGGSSATTTGQSSGAGTSSVGQLARGTADNPDEDSWTCMTRLAAASNWELYSTARPAEGQWSNFLYYRTGPNNDMQMPIAHLIRSSANPGTWDLQQSTVSAVSVTTNALLQQPTYTFDNTAFLYQTTKKKHGKKQKATRISKPQTPSQCQAQIVGDPFTINAGDVVQFQDSGPLNGRWIVSDCTRNILADLFNQVTLEPPTAPNAQPAGTAAGTTSVTPGTTPTGNVLSDVVAAAQAAVVQAAKYGYDQHRPCTGPLFGPVPRMMDCSGFVALCYKQANGPDPNGLNFSGNGSSYTMTSHCTKISQGDAKPGDLVIFPDHVVINLGGGNCISQGGPPGFPSGPKLETIANEMSYQSRGLTGFYRVPGV